MKVILTKIYISDKNKDGKPFVNKNGDKYSRIAVQCEEYGTKYLSGFLNKFNANWKEGDAVDIEVEKNGEFLNFKALSRIDLLEKRVEAMEAMMGNGHPEIGGHVEDKTVTEKDLPF